MFFCFLKQDTTYAMRISDWSSDVCASDLGPGGGDGLAVDLVHHVAAGEDAGHAGARAAGLDLDIAVAVELEMTLEQVGRGRMADGDEAALDIEAGDLAGAGVAKNEGDQPLGFATADEFGHFLVPLHLDVGMRRSEEHQSEIQSLRRH